MEAKYCQYCGTDLEEGCSCLRELAEAEEEFFDSYLDDPYVRQGAIQQDIIDMVRMER